MTQFLVKFEKVTKISILGHFDPLFAQNGAKIIFFRKSGFVTLFGLLKASLMQKIRKN